MRQELGGFRFRGHSVPTRVKRSGAWRGAQAVEHELRGQKTQSHGREHSGSKIGDHLPILWSGSQSPCSGMSCRRLGEICGDK